MASKTHHWVRIFEVNETKRHPKGHTIYQVKSTVFPRSSPEASTSVVVWRRYSEIRRLHRAISELHEKLGLPGQVPPFPRATILNRFETEVVEARRQATLNLLKFIGRQSSLFTSEPFTSFFQNDEKKAGGHFREKRKGSKGRSKEAEHLATTLGIQDSASLYSQLSESDDDLSLCSNSDHACLLIPAPIAPDFSKSSEYLGSDSVCEHDSSSTAVPVSRMTNGAVGASEISEESQRKIFSKNLQENHHSLQRTTEGQIVKEKVKHNQNFEPYQVISVEDSVFEFPQTNPNTHFVDTADLSEKHIINSSISTSSSLSYCVYENPVHDSPSHHEHSMEPQPSEEVVSAMLHSHPPLETAQEVDIPERKRSVPLTPLTPLTTTVTPYIPSHKAPNPQEVASSQYIFIAAQQISEAQQHEKQKDYKKALNMYREGVGTLLQGVQGDSDGGRRDAVKRKTAQYLQRAEQLMARLTRKDKKKDQVLDGPTAEISHNGEGDLKCRAADLQRYRVAGSTGSVIIATDISSGDTVAIKVLMKSGSGSGEKTVVPRGVPFMVPVIRYHETDTAIYLVLKFISGGKLWSHIKKYVEAEDRFLHNLHDTIATSTYSGRRLLVESLDCDRSTAEHLTLSHASHASQLSTASLHNIPNCTTAGDGSENPDISSSCLPEGYLQIYSEYDPSLPPSSSMLVLPHAHNTQDMMDSVPKSLSTGALSGTNYRDPCCVGPHDTGKSVAESDVIKDHILCSYRNGDNVAEDDRLSIGSDTLSGVSEDFSCSLPVGVPELLPDTLPLPEVRITMNNSTNNLCDELDQCLESKKNGDNNIEDYINNDCTNVVKVASSENGNEQLYSSPEKNQLIENGGKDITACKAMDQLGPEEENSITDTSFASTTLPSFSWTRQEDSEVASLDIEDLIRNSRQLLQNVDHTLLQSRSQSIIFPDSGENSSADHSELPYDGDSVSQDLLDKGGGSANQNSFDKKTLGINLSKGNAPVRLSPLMARRLGLDREGNKIKKVNLKSAKSEGNLSAPRKCRDVSAANKTFKIESETGNVKQADLSPTFVSHPAVLSLEQSQELIKKGTSSYRESPSHLKCDPPPESSLASILEKYSATRGQDSQPKLPEGIVKVWLSQVISAVSFLHQQGIIWGDLNPDNVLLDEGGSILVTYESRWSSVQQGVWRSQTSKAKKWMQKGYLAPELTSPLAYPTPASDWWCIGSLMYHLLTGKSISQAHPSGITSHTELLMPPHLSPEAVSLLSQLLCVHPTERLGGGGAGVQEVKDHTFFTGIQWVN